MEVTQWYVQTLERHAGMQDEAVVEARIETETFNIEVTAELNKRESGPWVVERLGDLFIYEVGTRDDITQEAMDIDDDGDLRYGIEIAIGRKARKALG